MSKSKEKNKNIKNIKDDLDKCLEKEYATATSESIILYLKTAQQLSIKVKENANNQDKEKEKESDKSEKNDFAHFLLGYKRPFEDQRATEQNCLRQGVLDIMKDKHPKDYESFILAKTDPEADLERIIKHICFPLTSEDKEILDKLAKFFIKIIPDFETILKNENLFANEADLKTVSLELFRAYIHSVLAPGFSHDTLVASFIRHMRNALKETDSVYEGICASIASEIKQHVLKINPFFRQAVTLIDFGPTQEMYLTALKEQLKDITENDFDVLMQSLCLFRDQITDGLSTHPEEEKQLLEAICQAIVGACEIKTDSVKKRGFFHFHKSKEKNKITPADLSCTLHLQRTLPKEEDIEQYKNSYLLVLNGDKGKLHYVNENGEETLARIGDFEIFIEKFKNEFPLSHFMFGESISLSDEQFRRLIKANGGFTHEKFHITEPVLLSKSSLHKPGSRTMPVDLSKCSHRQEGVMPDTIPAILRHQIETKKIILSMEQKKEKSNNKKDKDMDRRAGFKKAKSEEKMETTDQGTDKNKKRGRSSSAPSEHKKLNKVISAREREGLQVPRLPLPKTRGAKNQSVIVFSPRKPNSVPPSKSDDSLREKEAISPRRSFGDRKGEVSQSTGQLPMFKKPENVSTGEPDKTEIKSPRKNASGP